MLDLKSEENIEFLNFLNEEKVITDDNISFPSSGDSQAINVEGKVSNQQFILDINRKSLLVSRITYQNRIPQSLILLRLDIDTKPHRNPNGEIINGTHLHIFDKNNNSGSWAFELTDSRLNTYFKYFNFEQFLKIESKDVKKFFRNLNMLKIVKLRTCKSYHFETGLKTVSFLLFCQLNNITNYLNIDYTLFS